MNWLTLFHKKIDEWNQFEKFYVVFFDDEIESFFFFNNGLKMIKISIFTKFSQKILILKREQENKFPRTK